MKLDSQSNIIVAEKYYKIDDIVSFFKILNREKILVTPHKTDKRKTEVLGVDDIRDIAMILRSKNKNQRRVVVIDKAEQMTLSAQSAFLKLLEEPNEGIFYLLITSNLKQLAETIRSRCRIINYKTAAFKNLPADKIQQINFMAYGKESFKEKLATDEKFYNYFSDVYTDAKQFIFSPELSQLALINKYQKDRDQTLDFLTACLTLCQFALSKDLSDKTIAKSQKVLAAEQNIKRNCNIRLQLLSCIG